MTKLTSSCIGLGLLLLTVSPAVGAQLETFSIESHALKDNPLHDPSVRTVAVFVPEQAAPGERLPIVYYLPGFGYSSARLAKSSNAWLNFTQKIADEVTPMIFVVVDGHNRWGGSQYINSPAQGNYEDYVCDEIVPAVEKNYGVPEHGIRRMVAGHSSGGFGALRLGMARHRLFEAVIALSPDSDFPISHLPLVRVPQVSDVPWVEIQHIINGPSSTKINGDLAYALALSAAYAPAGWFHRGQFEWLYDESGHFRPKVWQMWLDNDPLTIARKNKDAFGPNQAVYLEGAAQDQYSANIGARKIFEAIQDRPGRHTFYEPPGRHSDHTFERLQRALDWVLVRPVFDIK